MTSAPTLSIVVPCFNERANIPVVVDALVTWGRDAVARNTIAAFEIVVVDDGSADGSTDAIEKTPELRVLRHEKNRGLTAALRTGFSGAQMELITWLPADGQIGATAVDALLAARRPQSAPLVLSTYGHRPDGIVRAVMSKTARVFVWAIIGFHGRLEGIYLFERALLDRIDLVSTRSAGIVAFELAAKVNQLGLTIATTEIECHERMSGRSKVADARNVMEFLAELLRIRASM